MIQLTDKIKSNLIEWEKQILNKLIEADKEDICTQQEIFQKLSTMQTDLYRLKALVNQLISSPESYKKSTWIQFNKIYERLEKKISESDLFFASITRYDMSPEIEGLKDDLKSATSKTVVDCADQIEELNKLISKKIERFERLLNEQTSTESEEPKALINKQLNRLQYFKDRIALWADKARKSDQPDLDKFKKEVNEALDECENSLNELSELRDKKLAS